MIDDIFDDEGWDYEEEWHPREDKDYYFDSPDELPELPKGMWIFIPGELEHENEIMFMPGKHKVKVLLHPAIAASVNKDTGFENFKYMPLNSKCWLAHTDGFLGEDDVTLGETPDEALMNWAERWGHDASRVAKLTDELSS